MKLIKATLLSLLIAASSFADEAKKSTADHLQDISVTIRAESGWSAGEGSGVIFTRKDKDGNLVNFVWTAAHVIDNLRTERKVIVNGSPRTLVEFKDAKIIKVIRQNGRHVGRLELDAEVIKWSDADDGHDLALLRIRKYNFVTDTVTFYLGKDTPALGTDLWHVGSLLGQLGANSMTDGIYSQHGRLIPSLNKLIFDQTTVAAFPGSSGGGVFLKSDARYIGMIVRGAGETFNLIVPVRRMVDWAKEQNVMWALDPKVPMPSTTEFKKLSIEDTNGAWADDDAKDGKKRKPGKTKAKNFPFLIRTEELKVIEVK